MSNINLEFKGKYILTGNIRCVTGLHIGGSVASIEIGGVDNPVIKDPLTDLPYIPGSALKGKLRSLFEWSVGLVMKQSQQQDKYAAHDCRELAKKRDESDNTTKWDNAFVLARLFGPASNDDKVREVAGPTRLTARDSFPIPESVTRWQEWLGDGIYTEVKTENAIDRVTSEATPRPMERVPADSEFGFEMIVDIYRDDDHHLFKSLLTAMRLLENSALGGGGSRGHGQIEFKGISLTWRSVDHYRNGGAEQKVALPGQDVKTLVDKFSEIKFPA